MVDLPNPFHSAACDAAAEGAAALSPQVPSCDAAVSLIGEIFVGARKLGYVPDDFDPDAITTTDRLLYDVLTAMVEPRAQGLSSIIDEQALWEAIEPPPLFLQAASY